jgi:protein-S-isoprenylcysteine O-methyltransferase
LKLPELKYLDLTEYAWIVLGVVFALGALKKRESIKKEKSQSQYTYLALLLLSFALIYSSVLNVNFLNYQLFTGFGLAGMLINFSGIAFALIARVYLGGLWSGRITIKENHRLIKNGPYYLSRHPIYTGMLFALAGAAFTQGEVRSVLSVILLFVAFIYRIRYEEELLKTQFPVQYPAYVLKTKKIIPFIY